MVSNLHITHLSMSQLAHPGHGQVTAHNLDFGIGRSPPSLRTQPSLVATSKDDCVCANEHHRHGSAGKASMVTVILISADAQRRLDAIGRKSGLPIVVSWSPLAVARSRKIAALACRLALQGGAQAPFK